MSKLVSECIERKQSCTILGTETHSGTSSNEQANVLVNEATTTLFERPEAFWGIGMSNNKKGIQRLELAAQYPSGKIFLV